MASDQVPPKFTFSIIKHRGSPREAETVDGVKVYRKDKLILQRFVDEFPDGIPCAPYSDHFVYVDPSKKVGRWNPMCTCGSPAVVVGYDGYKRDASAQGTLIVCMSHASTGRHADGTQG